MLRVVSTPIDFCTAVVLDSLLLLETCLPLDTLLSKKPVVPRESDMYWVFPSNRNVLLPDTAIITKFDKQAYNVMP